MSSVTKLEKGGSVTRETQALEEHEPLIVTLHPTRISLRRKGEGEDREVEVPLGQVYKLAQIYSRHFYHRRKKVS